MKVWIIVFVLILLIGVLAIVFLTKTANKVGEEAEKAEETGESGRDVAIKAALQLYEEAKSAGMKFSSQCLGTAYGYAVDIVHVPRASEDNLVENQCKEYREGRVSKFIELDKDGKVVRVVD